MTKQSLFTVIRSTVAGILFGALVMTARAAVPGLGVTIDNFTFGPQTITVKVGDTVTWANRDDIPHTVTSTTMVFRSKALDTDDTFSFTFATPGTYSYFCSLHPHMTGTVVVEAAAAK